MAVQQGQIFWQISRSGIEPSYLIGAKHDICLNQDSLPPEINAALENSKAGLIELSSNENTNQNQINTLKSQLTFSAGKTLSAYMSEADMRKVFEFIQSYLSEYDKDSFTVELWKQGKDVDITSYENFNRLTPVGIQILITQLPIYESFNERQKQSVLAKLTGDFSKEAENREKECLSEGELMDTYLERRVSCTGKPTHSIETLKSQVSDILSVVDYNFEAEKLIFMVDQLIYKRQKESGTPSEMDTILSEWGQFTSEMERGLQSDVALLHIKNIDLRETNKFQDKSSGFQIVELFMPSP